MQRSTSCSAVLKSIPFTACSSRSRRRLRNGGSGSCLRRTLSVYWKRSVPPAAGRAGYAEDRFVNAQAGGISVQRPWRVA